MHKRDDITTPDLAGCPIVLDPGFKNYDWGDKEFIPKLFGFPGAEQPYAEAWIGAHHELPAFANVAGGRVGLDWLLRQQGATLLGSGVQERFHDLPYLVKILAAAHPLSIQVHPSRSQAITGFRKEASRDNGSKSYRDPNPKPELIIALTKFDALCGFRPLQEIASALESAPELAALLPRWEGTLGSLRELVTSYFGLPDARVFSALSGWIERVRDGHPAPGTAEHWALEADRLFSAPGRPDRGLFFVLLLNLFELEPWQGLYLPAGVPHAYLRGAGVEVMASSDNVVRAGLTRKPVDTAELLALLRFDCGRPPILRPRMGNRVEGIYLTSAEEFEVHRVSLGEQASLLERRARGPEILLFLSDEPKGTLQVKSRISSVELKNAGSCLLPNASVYRVSSHGSGTLIRVVVPEPVDVGDFRGSRPRRLAFGTSGLRGLVADITDVEAYVNTRGFLDYLTDVDDARPGTPVALGGDLRASTDGPERSILRAVARAVVDAGFRPVNCGRLPTPALAYFAFQRKWPSIMVTGSHIPFDRNGIKFNKSQGEVLKPDEEAILCAIERARRDEYGRPACWSLFDDQGMFRPDVVQALPGGSSEARAAYVRRYVDFFPPGALAGARVVVYAHSAVGSKILAEVLRNLGAEVFPTGATEEFVAIDTEAITEERLKELRTIAEEACSRFGAIDAIVSTDGDSDRPMVVGIEPNGQVRFFGGDMVGILVADYLDADAIAVPVTATDAIDRHFAPRGIGPVRTRVGSPWVIAAMSNLAGRRKVGWESNGGFLTFSEIERMGRKISALPTRDALLPILAVLHATRERQSSLGQLFSQLPQRPSRAGLLDGVSEEESRALLAAFALGDPAVVGAVFSEHQTRVMEDSGSESEASDGLLARLRVVRNRLTRHFSPERGFAAVTRIDVLDGTRVTFANGDVAHVRASGNAPQLRIYAVAGSEQRAGAIVAMGVHEPDGILRSMLVEAADWTFVDAVSRSIDGVSALFERGNPAALIGTVCGSDTAQRFWQETLDVVRPDFRAREAISFHEDLPVNQAFGLLLLWQRLRQHLARGDGALVALVFGEGTRATPFTETDHGQKPAMASFVRAPAESGTRFLSMVELALRHFAPVEAFLRRSGFDGIVVKWGDEVQIPARDLRGVDSLYEGADVVRFVSMRAMTEESASNKDWIGVDAEGQVSVFIPRRPLTQMSALADRGLILRRGGVLFGGVNLGSIALSRVFLDELLLEFAGEIADSGADRRRRPDLDPQLFTALTVAAIEDSGERESAWESALRESEAIRALERDLPGIVRRLRAVRDRFAARHGRMVRMVALDFGDQYWGDIGQHRTIFDFYGALNRTGPSGDVARRLAGITGARDKDGNFLAGETRVGKARIRNSVLIDCEIEAGEVIDSVLIGTRAGVVRASGAFDILSVVCDLTLRRRAGSYKVIALEPVVVDEGSRVTTLFLPQGEFLMRVHEDTDLRDRANNYDAPILGNPVSFREAHATMSEADPVPINERRRRRIAEVMASRR